MNPTLLLITQFVAILTNVSIVIVGFKLIRHLTQIEMKVEMMWGEFKRKFEINEG